MPFKRGENGNWAYGIWTLKGDWCSRGEENVQENMKELYQNQVFQNDKIKPVNLYGYLIQKNNKMADKVVQCYGIVQTWEINCYTPSMENLKNHKQR